MICHSGRFCMKKRLKFIKLLVFQFKLFFVFESADKNCLFQFKRTFVEYRNFHLFLEPFVVFPFFMIVTMKTSCSFPCKFSRYFICFFFNTVNYLVTLEERFGCLQ